LTELDTEDGEVFKEQEVTGEDEEEGNEKEETVSPMTWSTVHL
jgi:hypothetical protein